MTLIRRTFWTHFGRFLRSPLALALPEHRYCSDQVRGHETCLASADAILRRLK